MSWQHVNETLTERIHLAKGRLSGTQNSSKAVFAGTSCSPSQATISLPSQDSSPSKGLREETEKAARPKVLQTDRLASGTGSSWQANQSGSEQKGHSKDGDPRPLLLLQKEYKDVVWL